MIKINLLPYRAARKRENIKRQITLYILCVFLLLAGMAYAYVSKNGELSALKTKQETLQKDLAKLQETIKKISILEKKTDELRAMLNVIRDLEKRKTGPVLLLSEISNAVPKEKLWLRSLKESNGILTLTGTAMDNETVALFMTRLEAQDHITQVDLDSARAMELKDYRLKVSNFDLKCKTYAYTESEKPEAAKKQGTRKK
ncbi:MAG: PilN domain-containing protein [Desulfatiglandales bacterium]